jgi:steroid 5-alpha reductase family enzyme
MIPLLAVATVVAVTLMGLTFVLARRIDNFSVVDIAWSFNFTPLAALYALLGSGVPLRRSVLFVVVALWSLRLSVHLARRIAALHPVEEGRYVELRRKWSPDVNGKFLRFFLFQGVLNVFLSFPLLQVALNTAPVPEVLETAGVLLFIASLAGEALADAQLNAFKRRPRASGGVCQEGLWRYSRHPNYFFEWLVWCAFALMASSAPWGLLAWTCPALMLYFLLRVTGIPATEEQSLRSRGQAYRDYQSRTSAFVPWFPRGAPERSSA